MSATTSTRDPFNTSPMEEYREGLRMKNQSEMGSKPYGDASVQPPIAVGNSVQTTSTPPSAPLLYPPAAAMPLPRSVPVGSLDALARAAGKRSDPWPEHVPAYPAGDPSTWVQQPHPSWAKDGTQVYPREPRIQLSNEVIVTPWHYQLCYAQMMAKRWW
jgi:hypothetical protein